VPRDAACRALLLALHRAGHIELPAPRWACREPWRRLRPAHVEVETNPMEGTLRELGPIELRHVARTAEEATVNGLLEEHHYLGYTTPVGERMKYLVTAKGWEGRSDSPHRGDEILLPIDIATGLMRGCR
jgi:hypothetical protein